MTFKGILMAGGSGTRLWPTSAVVNKHLFHVFDKPLVYYPLTTLMLAGIREVLLISTPRHVGDFNSLLGSGERFGMSITYESQAEARGIAEAPLIGSRFLSNSSLALILADNLFYGVGLGRQLRAIPTSDVARVFGSRVENPSAYGVAVVDDSGRVQELLEKPPVPPSNVAVPGLYFFDNTVVQRAEELAPSPRGELEITDLNRSYLADGKLELDMLPRGTFWLDAGSNSSLNQASNYVRIMEERQGTKVGCPEEVAWLNGWISDARLADAAAEMPAGDYRAYLEGLLD